MFSSLGHGTIKSQRSESQSTTPAMRRRRALELGIDVPLLLVTATLAIFGILMVYSASWDYSLLIFDSPTFIFSRQLMWLGLGVLVIIALTWIDYRWWTRLALPMMLGTIGLLVAVLFVSDVRHGAARTLFGGSVQPAELAKLVTVIYLSVWLYNKRDQLGMISFGLAPLAVILGSIGGLIFLQPDLSAVITIFFLGGTLFFLGGGDLRQIGLLLVGAALVGWLVVLLNQTGAERVADYWAGLKDPKNASYHVQRSIGAFVEGGWLGVGIGKGTNKLTGLPVPPTDSVFAVVGEETGVFGAGLLVILYILLLWRGLSIARRAPDGLGTLLAGGLTLWLVMEATVNMAAMLNLLPFAGNELPFISAGGSNLIVSIAAIGLLMNISRQSNKEEDNLGRFFSAVVNLRGRDRRRRVPRARRSASSARNREE